MNFDFLEDSKKNTQVLNLVKISSMGTGLFFAGRRTDMTKLTVAVHSSKGAHKKCFSCLENVFLSRTNSIQQFVCIVQA
jgi:hypothetical protein